jgi:hypothetical protein
LERYPDINASVVDKLVIIKKACNLPTDVKPEDFTRIREVLVEIGYRPEVWNIKPVAPTAPPVTTVTTTTSGVGGVVDAAPSGDTVFNIPDRPVDNDPGYDLTQV